MKINCLPSHGFCALGNQPPRDNCSNSHLKTSSAANLTREGAYALQPEQEKSSPFQVIQMELKEFFCNCMETFLGA